MTPSTDHDSWNDWRGYRKVTVTSGMDAPTIDTYTFYNGMKGDRLERADDDAQIVDLPPDLDGDTPRDWNWFAGRVQQHISKRSEGPNFGYTINEYGVADAETVGTRWSKLVVTERTTTTTTVTGGAPNRVTETITTHDTNGLPLTVYDKAPASDDRCTKTTYGVNTGAWIVNTPKEISRYDDNCTAATEADLVGQTKINYDQHAWGAAPTDGLPTTVYADTGTEVIDTHTSYDTLGRPISVTDGNDNTTLTRYVPAPQSNEVPDYIEVENAAGHETTTWYNRRADPIQVVDPDGDLTRIVYDALGRTSQVYLPTEPYADVNEDGLGDGPASQWFEYDVTRTQPPRVATHTLQDFNGSAGAARYVSGYAFFDGWGRARQTQTV